MIENIDCISFKRDCGSEPRSVSTQPKLNSHLQSCTDCADYYKSMQALDEKLMHAFQLPVHDSSIDEQLSSVQALSPNVVSLQKNKIQAYKPWFAAAASVTVAALALFALQYPTTAIAADVVEHLYHEPDLLTLTNAITNDEKIRMVLKHVNISLSGSEVEILAAKLCPLGGQLAAHLVVRGDSGPITVLIFPEMHTRSNKINTKEFNGMILPVEHGAIAMVGGKREDSAKMQEKVLNAFQWQK